MARLTLIASISLLVSSGLTGSGVCQSASADQTTQGPLAGRPFIGLRPGDRSNVGLLVAPAVQRELELTGPQEAKLRLFYKRMYEWKSERFTERREARRAGNPQRADEIIETLRAQELNDQAELKSLLTPEQNRRIEQITLQLDGPFAIVRPDVAEKLRLDEVQLEAARRIIAISKAGEEEIKREFAVHDREVQGQIALRGAELHALETSGTPASRGIRERTERINRSEFAALIPISKQARKRREALHRDAEKDLLRLLTKKQKAAYASLYGEPFKIEVLHQVDLSTTTEPSDHEAPPYQGR